MHSDIIDLVTPYASDHDFNHNTYKVEINLLDLTEVLKAIARLDIEFRLIDICAIDNSLKSDFDLYKFSCHYHLLNLNNFERYIFIIHLKNEEEKIPSVESFFPIAKVFENEIYDLFGMRFYNQVTLKNDRTLTRGNILGHPMRKDFSFKQSLGEIIVAPVYLDDKIKLSLTHPVQHGAPDISFKVSEGLIKKTYIETGNRHLGVEKILESNGYLSNIFLLGKLSATGSFNHSLVYVKLLEEVLEINIPKKAQAFRMIFSELSRISNHLNCIGLWAFELSGYNIYNDCNYGRELIYNLFKLFSDQRVNTDILCIGGIERAAPAGWSLKCVEVTQLLMKVLDSLKCFLGDSKIWHDRNQVGQLSSKNALVYGHTGPNLRASGINYDVRKRFPYYFYNEVDFHVPLGSDGTNFDRYIVRTEEIKQSIFMIIQLIDGLPSGDFVNTEHILYMQNKKDIGNDQESLDSYISQVQMSTEIPKCERYSSIESPNGELGMYLISDGKSTPYRLHLISPNIGYTESYKILTKNLALEDAGPVYRSLNINLSEVER